MCSWKVMGILLTWSSHHLEYWIKIMSLQTQGNYSAQVKQNLLNLISHRCWLNTVNSSLEFSARRHWVRHLAVWSMWLPWNWVMKLPGSFTGTSKQLLITGCWSKVTVLGLVTALQTTKHTSSSKELPKKPRYTSLVRCTSFILIVLPYVYSIRWLACFFMGLLGFSICSDIVHIIVHIKKLMPNHIIPSKSIGDQKQTPSSYEQ